MAASVRDLLMAADAKKSPFLSLLEGAVDGFEKSRAEAPARRRAQKAEDRGDIEFSDSQEDRSRDIQLGQQKRIIEAENRKRQLAEHAALIERKEKEDKKARAILNGDSERNQQQRQRGLGPQGASPNGGARLGESVSIGDDGYAKRTFKPGTKPFSGPRSSMAVGLTMAEETRDKKFATTYQEFLDAGGFADTESKINDLKDAVKELGSSNSISGPVAGSFSGGVADGLWRRANPRGAAVKDSVGRVAQRNLKFILGGQFTEKEGEALIRRSYDPVADEKENIVRVTRMLNQIKLASAAKLESAKYFEKYGTLRGFKGTLYTIRDGIIMPMSQLNRKDSKRAAKSDPPGMEKTFGHVKIKKMTRRKK